MPSAGWRRPRLGVPEERPTQVRVTQVLGMLIKEGGVTDQRPTP